jgi:hypothetical protein
VILTFYAAGLHAILSGIVEVILSPTWPRATRFSSSDSEVAKFLTKAVGLPY